MAVPLPNDLLRVSIRASTVDGGTAVNVWDCQYIQPGAAPSLSNFILGVDTAFRTLYANIMPSLQPGFQFTRIDVYNLTRNLPVSSGTPNPTWAGPRYAQGEALPSGVSALATWATGYRRSIAKKFLAGFVEQVLTGGVFTANSTAQLAAFGATALGQLVSSTTPAFNLQLGVAVSGPPWVFRPYISSRSTSVPAYQRRRKPGVGG